MKIISKIDELCAILYAHPFGMRVRGKEGANDGG